jgi:HCOMODA/2-hydroxy-3-carboxy-muconic semialdehyde decarboxylase
VNSADEELAEQLVVSNHILYDHRVIDGFGHISARSATDPTRFLMQRGGLVPEHVTHDDVVEYDRDSRACHDDAGPGPSERFIHGEIYRARPDVMAVVHSHTDAVLPYGVTKAALRAMIHTAYFLGSAPAPVFDTREPLGPDNDMLVATTAGGAALARTLADRAVVLMRGHGMTVAGPTVHDAVFRAVYTRVNARAQTEASKLGEPEFLNRFEVERDDPTAVHWAFWASQSRARRTPA